MYGFLCAHSVFIDVDCSRNVQASSLLPQPGWMTESRLSYSIFGSRARLPCKLSDLSCFERNVREEPYLPAGLPGAVFQDTGET